MQPTIITQVSRDAKDAPRQAAKTAQKEKSSSKLVNVFKAACKCFTADGWLSNTISRSLSFLPDQKANKKGRKTLVLDLDETLVHSTFETTPGADLIVNIVVEEVPMEVHVMKRPGVEIFLRRMSEIYEVIIFTASLPEYAKPLMKALDPEQRVDYQLYREHCTPHNSVLVKDLSRLGRSMKDVIIIDNSEIAFMFQPENAFHIENFFDDKSDRELNNLTEFMELMSKVRDVRSVREMYEKYKKCEEFTFENMRGETEIFMKKKDSNHLKINVSHADHSFRNKSASLEGLTPVEMIQQNKIAKSNSVLYDRPADMPYGEFAKSITDRDSGSPNHRNTAYNAGENGRSSPRIMLPMNRFKNVPIRPDDFYSAYTVDDSPMKSAGKGNHTPVSAGLSEIPSPCPLLTPTRV